MTGLQMTKTVAEWWGIGAKMLESDVPDERNLGFSLQQRAAFAGKPNDEPHTMTFDKGRWAVVSRFARMVS